MQTPATPAGGETAGTTIADPSRAVGNEEPLHISFWAAHWPGRRDRPALHFSVLYRWIGRGQDGIRLRGIRVPGAGMCCTAKDVAEFIRRVAAARAGEPVAAPATHTGARRRVHPALKRHGLARNQERKA